MQAIRDGDGVFLAYGSRNKLPERFEAISGVLHDSDNDLNNLNGFYNGLEYLSKVVFNYPGCLELLSRSGFFAEFDFGVESIDLCPKGEIFLNTSFELDRCRYDLILRLHEKDYLKGKKGSFRKFVYTSISHSMPPSSYTILSQHIGQATRRLEELIYPNKPGVEY
jgi:hypothetical protein